MFKKVLIPIDGSPLSSKVVTPLRRLLETDEPSEVILLHVHEGDDATQEAQQELMRLGQLCGASGVPGRARFTEGEPAEAILKTAADEGVDLIAMATHGRTGLVRLIRGSVAERVLRHTPAPLLLCNPACLEAEERDPAFKRILVPYDGSQPSAAVFPGAADLARAYDAQLVLLYVEHFSAGTPHSALRSVEELEEELQPSVEQLKQLGAREVEVRVEIGHAVDAILRVVGEASIDLLAMASHGSGLSRWWFGSTAEGVLRECPCPVFVIRTSSRTD